MTKRFLLIRHAATEGNLQRRYLGEQDEPLCEAGIREAELLLQSKRLPPITRLICAPALRCRQTAAILFPGHKPLSCPLKEIDFGLFRGKTAGELAGNQDYENWLETGCMGRIPGGESVTEFKARCCKIFKESTEQAVHGTTAMVIHGGNIMAIMERFARPKQDFYAYHLPNCGFFLCREEDGALVIEGERR